MPEKNEQEKEKVRERSRSLAVAAEVVAGNSTRREAGSNCSCLSKGNKNNKENGRQKMAILIPDMARERESEQMKPICSNEVSVPIKTSYRVVLLRVLVLVLVSSSLCTL